MEIDFQRTVGEVVTAVPHAAEVFEGLRIDYCCNGSRRLADACAEAGLAEADVRARLDAALTHPAEGFVDWGARPAPDLIAHLLATHHPYTRTSLERLDRLMKKVLAAHLGAHPELAQLAAVLDAMAADLIPHLMKEERVLFPYVLAVAARRAAGQPLGQAPFGTVRNPVQMMNREHEAVGELLAELTARTGGFTPPAGACATWRALYAGLRELQADLHRHIHLETHVLFPAAERLERGEG